MELADRQVAHTQKFGTDTFAVAAGKQLQIRYQEGEEIIAVLTEAVPAGKAWSVSIIVDITETDA